MKSKNSHFKWGLAITVLVLGQWACSTGSAPPASSTPTSAPTPTASPAPTPTLDVVAAERGIQLALDTYARAYNDNQPALLAEVVDQTNAPFRQVVQAQFDDFWKAGFANGAPSAYEVVSVKPQALGFVLAHVRGNGRSVGDWLFRQVEGRWVLSEPTPEQMGEPYTVETENFIFTLYPWADGDNQEVMDLLEQTRQKVLERLGAALTEKIAVYIYPGYTLTPDRPLAQLATYQFDTPRAPDLIEIYAPRSFAFGFYTPDYGWQDTLSLALMPEYMRLIYKRHFNDVGAGLPWILDGLTDYALYTDSVGFACLSLTMNPSDSPSMDPHSLVVYIFKEHGGAEGLWAFARAYDESQNEDAALQATFGVNSVTFDREWRSWVKRQC